VLDAGDAFGEIAILDDSPRTAPTPRALPTTLLALSRDHFQKLPARSTELRAAVGAMAEARRHADGKGRGNQ
jgi:CRP-like cAMP-binding protein